MVTINIESLGPTDGPSPSNRHESQSLLSLIEWRPGDQALLMFRVPDDYDDSGSISLIFDEIAPTSEVSYSWMTDSAVHKNGSNHGDSILPVHGAVTFDCSDPVTFGRIVTKTITVSSDDLAIDAGDIVSIRLEFECVEDEPCPEYLLTMAYRIIAPTAETVVTTPLTSGRLAEIAGEARGLFNEQAGDFLSDEFVVRAVNSCLRDIARENYWSAETWLPAVEGHTAIDVFEQIPDAQEIQSVWFGASIMPMTRVETFEAFTEISRQHPKTGLPEYYTARDNLVVVFPAPLLNSEHGYFIHYSRVPPPLGLSAGENNEPPVPKAFDSIFTLFVLKQAFLRDRNAPGADIKFREYSQLYEIEKKRLLESSQPSTARLRTSR